jgi:predicted MFS family arabinose efflux permease
VTNRLTVFLVLTYLSALFTGATQIMLPLVAELAPPETRAFNISIVGAGPTLGILLARILSGIVTNYTSWRNVYWLALGLQGCVLVALWLFMPDYPATNSIPVRQIVKTYPNILWSILTLYPKHAVLVQAALVSFCTFFALTSFWTTLTFLLAGSPYHYNSTDIGLFGLVGLGTMLLGPIYGKYVIQPLREPLFSVIVGKTVSLVGIVVGTYAGTHNVAGPIIQAFMLDAGLMIVQIANRMAIHGVEPQGRNRVNTAFVSVMYLGQLTGTKAGNEVYEKYGGWIASGSLSVAVIAFSYVIIALRGPYEQGWIGWGGGWRLKPKEKKGDGEEGSCVAEASVEMKDVQGRESAARGNDEVDNLRSQTAKDEEVDGEKGRAPVPESLHFDETPSDHTEKAAHDGTVDSSLLMLPPATGTLQSMNEGHSMAESGENVQGKDYEPK